MPNGYRVSCWGDENVLELDRGSGCTTLCMYPMPLNCTLSMVNVNFLLYEFCLNKKWGKALSWRLMIIRAFLYLLYLENSLLSKTIYLRISETCLTHPPLLLPCDYSQDRAGWASPPW